MKERLCLEVERLGLSAVIMGSRGFGASKRTSKGRLGSVSDYCVHHCVWNFTQCRKRSRSTTTPPMSRKMINKCLADWHCPQVQKARR
ncbi:unnamed protein product, partial [Vitis vinifera]